MIQGRPYDDYMSHEGICNTIAEAGLSNQWLLSNVLADMLAQTPRGFVSPHELFTYFNTLLETSNSSNTPMSMEARQQLLELMWLLFWNAK